jgi:hypothetical protein
MCLAATVGQSCDHGRVVVPAEHDGGAAFDRGKVGIRLVGVVWLTPARLDASVKR